MGMRSQSTFSQTPPPRSHQTYNPMVQTLIPMVFPSCQVFYVFLVEYFFLFELALLFHDQLFRGTQTTTNTDEHNDYRGQLTVMCCVFIKSPLQNRVANRLVFVDLFASFELCCAVILARGALASVGMVSDFKTFGFLYFYEGVVGCV